MVAIIVLSAHAAVHEAGTGIIVVLVVARHCDCKCRLGRPVCDIRHSRYSSPVVQMQTQTMQTWHQPDQLPEAGCG